MDTAAEALRGVPPASLFSRSASRSVSPDSKLKWSIIAVFVMTDLALLIGLGLKFALPSLLWPLGFVVLLSVVGLYYRRRREPDFVLCINALLHLVVFSSSYTVLMYCLATLGRPLIDAQLVGLDAWFGFHLPDLVNWMQSHPTADGILKFAYSTLLPQTALVTALGLLGDRRPLEVFLQRFMLSALLAAAVFCLFPAAGPFEAYGFERDADQDRYMVHFEGLRDGEMTTLSLNEAEGLITFPSFHTTWAILLALACAHRRVLFGFSALLNGMVVVSTMTTGWHYFSDVLAGIVLAVVVVVVCGWMGRWTHPQQKTPGETLPADPSM